MKMKVIFTTKEGTEGVLINQYKKNISTDVSVLKKSDLLNAGHNLVDDILDNWDKYKDKDKEKIVVLLNNMNALNFELEKYDPEKKKIGWLDYLLWMFSRPKK